MLQTLFAKQREYLDHFFSTVDLACVEKVLEKVHGCQGVVVLSGVGKSGHIARKISTTLISTGTRSTFLCPSHALHGDVGFIQPQDICLLFSKSGESQELLDLIPHLQRKGSFVIAAVSHMQSRLAKSADMAVFLPVQQELCPFDLAPTTSTTVQLLFGDCLAIALMEKRRFSMAEFATNHPAGFLGRKMTLKVSDLMLSKEQIPICFLEDRLIDSLHELSTKKCGCLLVCDPNLSLCGIFTDGDLRRAVEKKGGDALQLPLKDLMSAFPITIKSDMLAFDAMRVMEKDPSRLVTVLPVVENGILLGLLRMHDILQAGLR